MPLLLRDHSRAGLILGIALAMSSGVAYGARGTVVATLRGCDYFLVESPGGFALLEWYGGALPVRGNVMVGDYETYGFKDIFDVTADNGMKVWVEDYWLTKARAASKMADKCD